MQTGPWSELGHAARALRHAVFIAEQGIEAPLDGDSADAGAVHAVAFNRAGMALATGRLVSGADGQATLSRMAVVQSMRQRHRRPGATGAGTRRRAQGAARVSLQAAAAAVPFYERTASASTVRRSRAGQPHQTMTSLLVPPAAER